MMRSCQLMRLSLCRVRLQGVTLTLVLASTQSRGFICHKKTIAERLMHFVKWRVCCLRGVALPRQAWPRRWQKMRIPLKTVPSSNFLPKPRSSDQQGSAYRRHLISIGTQCSGIFALRHRLLCRRTLHTRPAPLLGGALAALRRPPVSDLAVISRMPIIPPAWTTIWADPMLGELARHDD